MGKWDALRDKYPQLPAEASYDDAVYAEMDALQGLSLDALTSGYNDLQAEKDRLNAELSAVNLRLGAHERMIDRGLEGQGMDSAVLNGYRWTRSPAPYPKVTDKAALRTWAELHVPDALALHSGTLKSLVREALETGDTLPDGIDVYYDPAISRKRA